MSVRRGCSAALLLTLIAACRISPERTRAESGRLRASVANYQAGYLKSIGDENRLIVETLAWLNGPAVEASRSHAVADARAFMDRWARVYFVPRHMHQQLRFDEYSSGTVREVQRHILEKLKRRYFELHDYQRYAQHASESAMHQTPAGRLPAALEEFRRRLEVRTPAVDEISPLLAPILFT